MRTKQWPENEQEADPLARRETLEVVRAYYRMPDPVVRMRLAELVKALAKAGQKLGLAAEGRSIVTRSRLELSSETRAS
jgi:hypothetical protein